MGKKVGIKVRDHRSKAVIYLLKMQFPKFLENHPSKFDSELVEGNKQCEGAAGRTDRWTGT